MPANDDRPEASAEGRVRFARVTEATITVDECVDAVEDARHGAVVSFAGVVRDHDDGRGVTALDYEAHPHAGAAIERAAAAIVDRWPDVVVAVSHRVGSLVVGDIALACAVASAHRADAFAACGALVDEVKATVPIWKNQEFTDGTTEWVGSLG